MPIPFPAARQTDMHLCPMIIPSVPPVPHVGGPIIAGSPNVLINGLPAARVGDIAMCTGCGIPDPIAKGSPTVLINGMMAARVMDTTSHGGMIILGSFNVLIGASPIMAQVMSMLTQAARALAKVLAKLDKLISDKPGDTIAGIAQAMKDAVARAAGARTDRRDARNRRMGEAVKGVIDEVVSRLDPNGTNGLADLGNEARDIVDGVVEGIIKQRHETTQAVVDALNKRIDRAADRASEAARLASDPEALREAIRDEIDRRIAEGNARTDALRDKAKGKIDEATGIVDPDGDLGIAALGDEAKDAVDRAADTRKEVREAVNQVIADGVDTVIDKAVENVSPLASGNQVQDPAAQAAAMQDAAKQGAPALPIGP